MLRNIPRPVQTAAALAWITLLVVPLGCAKTKTVPPKPALPEVLYSFPTKQEVTDFDDFTGRAEATKSVEIRARVTGYLQSFNFEEGSDVREGDVLFVIDDRPYKASLEQAEAEVAQAQARLARADADFVRARNTFNRDAISRSEYDVAAAAFAEAKATIGVAEAKRDMARLNWTWTKVTAPISGQISRRLVDPGNLVQADLTPLTSIVSTEKMYVSFAIDERTLLSLRRLVSTGKIPTRDEKQLKVYAALGDEQNYPREGYVDFSDNQVDPSTGTLLLRGIFENPVLSTSSANRFVRRLISPGLFVKVRLPKGQPHPALLVPEKSIGSDQGQKYVYVISEKDLVNKGTDVVEGVVVRRDVIVGSQHEDMRAIESGLQPNERVVVSGVQRVRVGKQVQGTLAETWQKQREAIKPKSTSTGELSSDSPKEHGNDRPAGTGARP